MRTVSNAILRAVLFALLIAPALLSADTPAPFQAAARSVPPTPGLAGDQQGNWVGRELGQPGTGCLELAKERSVSKQNNFAFLVRWTEHWANEVEFVFE